MLLGAEGQIPSLLARAQVAYAKRDYTNAIALYKQARSEVFKLLNPAHPTWLHVHDASFVLPVSVAIETKFAEAGLKLAEVNQPAKRWDLPPVGAAVELPPDALQHDRIGFVPPAEVSPRAAAQSALGIDLLDRGFPDQAAEMLNEANRALAQPATVEARTLSASTNLALSGASLLAGQADNAAGAAAKAVGLFTQLGDDVGTAQALHNQGVALTKAGHAADARPLFARAVALAGATPAPATSSETAPPSGHPTPLRTVFDMRRPTLVSEEKSISFVTASDLNKMALRVAGPLGGPVGTATVQVSASHTKPTWAWAIPVGKQTVEIKFEGGKRPDTTSLIDAVYKSRMAAQTIEDLQIHFAGLGEVYAYLPHLYAFVIPQALGDCYSHSGSCSLAETYYLQAAAYSYINRALEVPALWVRLADNRLRWGDALYRSDQVDECKAVYGAVVTEAGAAGNAPLFTLRVFTAPATDAKKLLGNAAKPQDAGVSPAVARPLLTILARWQYLRAGLDFFGTLYAPTLTFEYLQQVATEFAQQAVQAQREYVDFQARSEAADATRHQLQSAVAVASASAAAQNQLRLAAGSDAAAAQAAVDLAHLRANDAASDRQAYANDGYWQYVSASIAAAHAAHADWHEQEIRQLAANMESGSWSGDPAKLSAAATLLGGQKSFEYQLERLDNSVAEMNAMIPVASDQANAAQQRAEAARLQYEAAVTQAALAQDALNAFDNNVFTPEVWSRMAAVMRELSADYLDHAIRLAKLMERAYGFENDEDPKVIRSEYPGLAGAGNLFGADFLLRDIQSFTYRFIANQRAKQSQLKDVISLANDFPFAFMRFQNTGQMSFETTLLEADRRHPGFFQQRIAGVELEVIGLMPPEGLRGSMRAGGISRYRTAGGGERTRIHAVDTLALSDFATRNDAFVFRIDPRMHGLFEGHGVATTWKIDLPRRSNNLDFRLLTDVRLVIYYSAFFDAALHDRILTAPAKPSEMIHVRSLVTRFDFPESWYTLLDTGTAILQMADNLFPRNETGFRLQTLAVVVTPREGFAADGLTVSVQLPGKAAVTATTDAHGQIASPPGSALAGQMGGNALGDWVIGLQAAAGSPLLAADGKLDGDKIEQVLLLIQYHFDWRG